MSFERNIHSDSEGLIADVHDAAECADLTHDDVHRIESALDHSEMHRMFQLYEARACPTLDDIDAGCRRLSDMLREEQEYLVGDARETIARTISYLEARRAQIAYAVGTYVDTIAQMYRLQHNRTFMDDTTYRDMLTAADARRRQKHNALMDSLRELNNTVDTFSRDGVIDTGNISRWNGWNGTSAQPTESSPPTLLLFSNAVLTHERREEVQHWAVVADLSENLRLLRKRVAEEIVPSEQ